MGDVVSIDEARAVAPHTAAPQAGESASSDSPADHCVNVEQAIQAARTAVDYLYAGTWDENFLRAVAENRELLGPIMQQLLEVDRQCEKVKVE